MKMWFLFILYLLFLTIAGCSQVMVSQDYDKAAHFSQYTTYSWIEPSAKGISNIQTNNPLLHNRFQTSINRILQNKGYTLAGKADLHVNYEYSIRTKIQSKNLEPTLGYGYGRYGRYGGIAVRSGSDIYQYDQGILVINLYDARTKNLIWRGKGTDVAATHPDPDKVTAQVFKLVSTILQQFPPQP